MMTMKIIRYTSMSTMRPIATDPAMIMTRPTASAISPEVCVNIGLM